MKDDLAAAGQAVRMCEAKYIQARIMASHEYSDSLAAEYHESIFQIMQALQLLRPGLRRHCAP